MPELPEVETVRKQFAGEMIGEVIAAIEVRDEKCFDGDFKHMVGEKIEGIERYGKWLLVELTNGRGIEIHLKMTGRLVVDDEYDEYPHTRVVVSMNSGRKLYYWDTRKFGYVRALPSHASVQSMLQQKLGPEPWDMTEKEFMGRLKKTGRKIKDAILDQSLIAGVGNIYANDGLWKARILPTKKANELSKKEASKLLHALREVMRVGLKTGGASDVSFRDFYGKLGTYQKEFLVYGGGECKKCEKKLEYGKVGGRGTWWCEGCQS